MDLHTFLTRNLVEDSKILIGECSCESHGTSHQAFAELDFIGKGKRKSSEFRVSCTAGLPTHTWASITLHPNIRQLGNGTKGTLKKFLGPQIYTWHTFNSMGVGSAQRQRPDPLSSMPSTPDFQSSDIGRATQADAAYTPPTPQLAIQGHRSSTVSLPAATPAKADLQTARIFDQDLAKSDTAQPIPAAPQSTLLDLQIFRPESVGQRVQKVVPERRAEAARVNEARTDVDMAEMTNEEPQPVIEDSAERDEFNVVVPPLPSSDARTVQQYAGAVMIHHARAFIENHSGEMALDSSILIGLWATGQSEMFQNVLSATYMKYFNKLLPEYVNRTVLPVPVVTALLGQTKKLWPGWGWGSGQVTIHVPQPSQEGALRRQQARKEADERRKQRDSAC